MRSWGIGEMKGSQDIRAQGGFLRLDATDSGEKELGSA